MLYTYISGKLVKGDPKLIRELPTGYIDIPGKGGSKEKTLSDPFAY